MRIAFFSPLPPERTGVADYSAALLEALRRLGTVEVDGATGTPLYHVGNNHLHRQIYQGALERPGVVVLHDAVLQHFFLGSLDQAAYIEEFVYNYGEWMRELGSDLWRRRARSAADPLYFSYPMLKRIASVSRAIIVHNPAAANAVRRHAPDVPIFEIPHLFVPPQVPDAAEALRFRTTLGLGPRTLLAGVFGHLRESKRLPVILRAVERAANSGTEDIRLLAAGAFASTDLERALAQALADPRILRVGYLPEPDFWRYAAATDVCLNLRFPTAGESSGIAIRMMGIGKPVVFTAGEEIARFPDDCCLRVDLGAGEEETLAATLSWFASDRGAAAEIGRRAARHIAAEHAIDRIAELYWNAIKTS